MKKNWSHVQEAIRTLEINPYDEDAMATIMTVVQSEVSPVLLHRFYKYGFNQIAVDGILERTYIRIWEYAKDGKIRAETPSKTRSWVFRTAMNIGFNILTKVKRVDSFEDLLQDMANQSDIGEYDEDRSSILMDDDAPSPEEKLIDENIAEMKKVGLRQLFEVLTEPQKEVFMLLAQGIKAVEIARLLEKSPASIAQHKNAIRKKAKKIFENLEKQDGSK